ncbi:uncharacterized protein LOC117241080 [Bombus vosnesenskii]|uniref:Uncharacterized protein LOC117241080 n=1 Tax=Bombus vosnesenskii TaxID=207650 RepID=A0A6J3LBF9_9HYME|nr:uncharacterized protein LOC117241080 [Bombus vosnesenskii]
MDATTINDQSDEFSWKSALKTYVGETLELTGVLRQEMGTCLCIDSNNVPPTVSKRYSVQVHCKQNKNLPSTVAGDISSELTAPEQSLKTDPDHRPRPGLSKFAFVMANNQYNINYDRNCHC